MKIINQREPNQQIQVENSNFSESVFNDCYAENIQFHRVSLPRMSIRCGDLRKAYYHDVTLAGSKIQDANLSDLEIDGAQMGGAYIHNIGMPPEGHPAYDANQTVQKPLLFENCKLNGSTIKDCDLSGVEIANCDITGMTIDGIEISEVLAFYKAKKG